jgi:hypothetical protein
LPDRNIDFRNSGILAWLEHRLSELRHPCLTGTSTFGTQASLPGWNIDFSRFIYFACGDIILRLEAQSSKLLRNKNGRTAVRPYTYKKG